MEQQVRRAAVLSSVVFKFKCKVGPSEETEDTINGGCGRWWRLLVDPGNPDFKIRQPNETTSIFRIKRSEYDVVALLSPCALLMSFCSCGVALLSPCAL